MQEPSPYRNRYATYTIVDDLSKDISSYRWSLHPPSRCVNLHWYAPLDPESEVYQRLKWRENQEDDEEDRKRLHKELASGLYDEADEGNDEVEDEDEGDGIPRQFERDLRTQRIGRGKHRQKWMDGKRTGGTIRYCVECEIGAPQLVLPSDRARFFPGYSLNKKQRWRLLESDFQRECEAKCDEKDEIEEDDDWEGHPGAEEYKKMVMDNKKKRDKLRLRVKASNHVPSYTNHNLLPPHTPVFRSKKRPHFLYNPSIESYRIQGSDLAELFNLQQQHSTNPEESLRVYTVDDPHRLPESERNLRLALCGGHINTSNWGDYWCAPSFKGNKKLAGEPCLSIVRTACSHHPRHHQDEDEHNNNHNTRVRRGRCNSSAADRRRRGEEKNPYPKDFKSFKQQFRKGGYDDSVL